MIIWLVGLLATSMVVAQLFPRGRTFLGPVTARRGIAALAAIALVLFLQWVLFARTRLVITRFVDYRQEPPQELQGLSRLLAAELGRLFELHQTVDDSRADPEALLAGEDIYFDQDRDRVSAAKDEAITPIRRFQIPATIKVGLRDDPEPAVSVEAVITVGWVKVPVGTLTAVASRIARGRRVSGSVHFVDDKLVLTAATVGNRNGSIWRVETRRGAPGEDTEPRPEDLVDELAVRIFSNVALKKEVKWRASWAHIQALRAYRECLRTARDRRANLEKAKRYLVEAISEDATFDLAHYNLGIVATELGQLEAAETAFQKAITCNPDAWQSYYGLAQLYFAQGWYREMVPLCGRMIALDQRVAEAYLLRAQAHYRLVPGTGQADQEERDRRADAQGRGGKLTSGDTSAGSELAVISAMKDSEAAVRAAWPALCRAAFRGNGQDAADLAAKCLRNLGGMRAYDACGVGTQQVPEAGCSDVETWVANQTRRRRRPRPESKEGRALSRKQRLGFRAAQSELRQAVELRPSDGELHFELAKLYAARERWFDAIGHLDHAVEIAPDRPRFWIQLARAHAGLGALDPTRPDSAGAQQASGDAGPGRAPSRKWRPHPGRTHHERQKRRAEQRQLSHRNAVELACRRALERPSLIIDSGFRRMAMARQLVGLENGRIRALCQFEAWRSKWTRDWDHSVKDREGRPTDVAFAALQRRLQAKLEEVTDQGHPLAGEPWPVCALGVTWGGMLVERPPADVTAADREDAARLAAVLQGSLEELNRRHPSEVERNDVYAVIARLLHLACPLGAEDPAYGRETRRSGFGRLTQQQRSQEEAALAFAQKAVALAPLSVYAQEALATIHTTLGHFKQAELAWKAALSCKSDAPELNEQLGRCLLRLGVACFDRRHRTEKLQEAKRYLSHAVWLCEVGCADAAVEDRARFALGQVLVELEENERAVEELQLALEPGDRADQVRRYLGRAYLGMGAMSHGERELAQITEDHWARLDLQCSRIERTPDPHLRSLPLPVHTRRATYTHRINDPRLEKAIDAIRDIRRCARSDDDIEQRELRAACDDWEGWAKFKLHDYDGARRCLIASIDCEPSAGAYSHLAQVTVAGAVQTRFRSRRRQMSALAWDYAGVARRHGLTAVQSAQLDTALSRLNPHSDQPM